MDYSEVVILLDRSGSMQTAKSDHEGGLRQFVQDQQKLPGDVRFTLIQFDGNDPCEIIYSGVPISDVGKIELIPRGNTPLLDAVGKATAHVEQRLNLGARQPDMVLFMIVTDGHENASKEWTRERVKSRVVELEKKWRFIYLGANVDAFGEAGQIGLHAAKFTAVYTADCAKDIYRATSDNLLKARNFVAATEADCDKADVDENFAFTDEQRKAMEGGKAS